MGYLSYLIFIIIKKHTGWEYHKTESSINMIPIKEKPSQLKYKIL